MDRIAAGLWVPGIPAGVWMSYGTRWAGLALIIVTVLASAAGLLALAAPKADKAKKS